MGIALAQLLDQMFGVKSRHQINSLVSQVGVTAIPIMNANPNRLSFIIFNLSVNSVYISPDPDVSSVKGMYIAGNGGFFMSQWDVDFQLPSMQFFGIATGAASNVFILENISY